MLPIAHVLAKHRRWIYAGQGIGFCLMLMATSVTAIPPTPGRPPFENVIGWFWQRFAAGKLASWQQPILIERGIGDGDPTLPFSFNLGQLAGLNGLWSLLPFIAGLGFAAWSLRRVLRAGAVP